MMRRGLQSLALALLAGLWCAVAAGGAKVQAAASGNAAYIAKTNAALVCSTCPVMPDYAESMAIQISGKQIRTAVDPGGDFVSYTYSEGRVLPDGGVGPDGYGCRFTFDGSGSITAVSPVIPAAGSAQASEETRLDSAGRPVYWEMEFTASGRQTETRKVVICCDEKGRVSRMAEVTALGGTISSVSNTACSYDSRDRLTGVVRVDSDGITTKTVLGYNRFGEVLDTWSVSGGPADLEHCRYSCLQDGTLLKTRRDMGDGTSADWMQYEY